MKKICLLNITSPEIINAIACRFRNQDVEIISSEYNENTKDFIENNNFDIVVIEDYYSNKIPLPDSENIINVHPSLLPAFKDANAVQQAFACGVKVSGITIHNLKDDKIIAQYPVLIGLETGIQEFNEEKQALEQKILPAVIESLLDGRVFDFSDLLNNSCSNGGCSHCKGCK